MFWVGGRCPPRWNRTTAGSFRRVTLLGQVEHLMARGRSAARSGLRNGVRPTDTVERTMLSLFLAMRGGILLLEGPLYRGTGRRPTAGSVAAWAAVATSTTVSGYRGFPRPGRQGVVTVAIDTAATAAALAIRSFDAPGEFDWTAGAAFWSAAAVGGPFESRLGQVLAVTPLAIAYGAVRTRRSGAPVRGMRVVQDVVLLYTFAVGIGEVIRRLRLAAAEIESETERAVRAAEVATRLEEELLARGELHVGAIRALETIRSQWRVDAEGAKRTAAIEARRIRRWLSRDGAAHRAGRGSDLLAGLDAIVDEAQSREVQIDVMTIELGDDVQSDAAAALLLAVGSAVEVAARAGDRILVRVMSDEDSLRATARSQGSGPIAWEDSIGELAAVVAPRGGHIAVVGDRLEIGFPT